jgi:FKBP-type peptidyl-prolyl cis-trans isomerase
MLPHRRHVPWPGLRAALAGALLLGGGCAEPDGPAEPEAPFVTTPSGLRYQNLRAGPEGPRPLLDDTVRVHYTGRLVSGQEFDSSHARGAPTEFGVGRVIPGWKEALTLMTVGSLWRLEIPPDLAYGQAGSPPAIPPGATLRFEVELLGILPRFREGRPEAQRTTPSGLRYEVLEEGSGDPPGEDDVVELRYAVWGPDRALVDSSERHGPIRGLPRDMQVPFLREAASLMQPGSVYRFEVPPALGVPPGPRFRVPAGSTTVWELGLLRVLQPLPLPAFALPEPGRATRLPSGLEIETLREGTGASPRAGQEVTVHYAGWLTDGSLFDSSYGRGDTTKFRVGGVIRGWNEALQRMRVGGMVRLLIPPALGYGDEGSPPKIPPGAALVFVIELEGVTP